MTNISKTGIQCADKKYREINLHVTGLLGVRLYSYTLTFTYIRCFIAEIILSMELSQQAQKAHPINIVQSPIMDHHYETLNFQKRYPTCTIT